MDRRPIVPESMLAIPRTRGYLPGLVAGGFLFAAGQVGRTRDLVVISDPEAQFVACFENLRLVLAEAGCGFEDIVDLTTYHVDFATHWPLFRARRPPFPTRSPFTTLCRARTPGSPPGLLLEVKAIARLPAGAAPR